ncbi:hypothetical protein GCM10022247_02620 [Allokutzneria multivorans]|uniref:Uncharacterized protein n=1 Tax=Allokutzneria multivorans TaxID=1142134 RepID=A0ABP7QTD8_9PSEU
MGLGDAALPQLLPLGEEAVSDLALLTPGRHDEHDAVTLLVSLAHDTAAPDALVVGVSVKRHQSGHALTLRDLPPAFPRGLRLFV